MSRLWQWITKLLKLLRRRRHNNGPTLAVGSITYGKDHQTMSTQFAPDVHFQITDNQAVDLDVEFSRVEHDIKTIDKDTVASWSSDDPQQSIASFTPGPTIDLKTKQPMAQDPLLRKCRFTGQNPGDVTITALSADGGAGQRFIGHIVRPADSSAVGTVSAPVEQDAAPVAPAPTI